MDQYEEAMLIKLDSGKELTKEDIRYLVSEFNIMSTEFGDNRRWMRNVTSVIQIADRFFKVDWQEGLTECQENEYYEQPTEVEKKIYEKMVTVTEWIQKK